MERRRRTRREDVERIAVGALRRRAQHGRGSTGRRRRTRREDVERRRRTRREDVERMAVGAYLRTRTCARQRAVSSAARAREHGSSHPPGGREAHGGGCSA